MRRLASRALAWTAYRRTHFTVVRNIQDSHVRFLSPLFYTVTLHSTPSFHSYFNLHCGSTLFPFTRSSIPVCNHPHLASATRNPLDAILDHPFPPVSLACRRLKTFFAPLQFPRERGFSLFSRSFSPPPPRVFAFPSGSRTHLESRTTLRTHQRGVTSHATVPGRW